MRVLMACVALCAGIVTITEAAEVRQLVAVDAGAVTLDGVLDEPFWAQAEVTEPFVYLATTVEAHLQTRVRTAYDDANLYLAIEADDPHAADPRAPQRERDANEIWRDDCIELFLTPEIGGINYYHLIFNWAGAKHDARSGTQGDGTAWQPDPDWQVAIRAGDAVLTAEVAIPFAGLGAEAPLRGELWGLKIARSLWDRGADRNADRHTVWAHAQAGYHDPAGWGWLYFGGRDMLDNPDFQQPPAGDGLPRGWRKQLNWNQGDADTGDVTQIERDGRPMMLLHKNPEAEGSLLPRATLGVRVRAGHRYRFSAEVQAKGSLELIFSYQAGEIKGYLPMPFELDGAGFETLTTETDIPKGISAVSLMFSFDRASTGDMLVRHVELTDLGATPQEVEVDRIHHLRAAAETFVEMKPDERLSDEDGSLPFERLIFTDTGTGAEIRRVTWDRSTDNITYSNMYPWNPAGTAFKFSSWERVGPLYFIADPSGAALRPLGIENTTVQPSWGTDPATPDLLYYGTTEGLHSRNWRTGEDTLVFRIPDEIRHGGRGHFHWDLALPGLVYYEQAFGMDAPLYFVDLNTGKWTRIPLTSDSTGDHARDWLYSAHLTRLRGQWWVGYSLNHLPHLSQENPYQQRLSSLDGTVGIDRLKLEQPEGKGPQPLYSHGGQSPDGRWETGYHSGGIALWDKENWEGRMLVPGPGDGHISWMYLNEFFVAGTMGAPLSGPFAAQILKVYRDGTWYRVAYGNTTSREYSDDFFVNLSPDGTKVAYHSSMLGPVCLYWCVMAHPDPPTDVTARRNGAQVNLTWTRPERSAELAGYRVYRSTQSGIGWQRLTEELVTGESFTDTAPGPGAGYYIVTAVEHSGLESWRHSGEAVAGDPAGAPERLFLEAEQGELTAPVRENFHGSASDLRFVDYRDGEGQGAATWAFPTRNAGPHTLWARMRYQGAGTPGAGWQVSVNGKPAGELTTGAREWTWEKLPAPVVATAGGTTIAMRANGEGFAIDKLLLTDDAAYTPQGMVPIDATAPAAPGSLTLDQVREFDIALSWQPVGGDCEYYHVYRGAEDGFAIGPETRIASPEVARMVDWGLKQGTDYFYRVTAVDSFGNESEPSPALAARTVALGQVVSVHLEAEAGATDLPMVRVDEEHASGGAYVKMAPEGEGDAQRFPRLDLQFDVPVAGDYIAWLRLCPVSDRGYAYLSATIDGAPSGMMLCHFPARKPGRAFADANMWVYANNMRVELPLRFELEPGRHTFTVSQAHMQDFGIDEVIITNDLGTRPEGRHYPWDD